MRSESLQERPNDERTASDNRGLMTLENSSTVYLLPTFDKKIKILEKEKG